MRDELEFARRVSREAGDIVRGYFGQSELSVDMKGWADPVTAADRAAEAHIRSEMARHFSDDGIHGEEEGRAQSRSGRVWIVDPLDGTANFAGGMPIFAVCRTGICAISFRRSRVSLRSQQSADLCASIK